MVESRDINLLYGSFSAIRESAEECLKYRIPRGVEDYLLNIKQIAEDWMRWIEEAKKEMGERDEHGRT